MERGQDRERALDVVDPRRRPRMIVTRLCPSRDQAEGSQDHQDRAAPYRESAGDRLPRTRPHFRHGRYTERERRARLTINSVGST